MKGTYRSLFLKIEGDIKNNDIDSPLLLALKSKKNYCNMITILLK